VSLFSDSGCRSGIRPLDRDPPHNKTIVNCLWPNVNGLGEVSLSHRNRVTASATHRPAVQATTSRTCTSTDEPAGDIVVVLLSPTVTPAVTTSQRARCTATDARDEPKNSLEAGNPSLTWGPPSSVTRREVDMLKIRGAVVKCKKSVVSVNYDYSHIYIYSYRLHMIEVAGRKVTTPSVFSFPVVRGSQGEGRKD
jgi:hypothetical protein